MKLRIILQLLFFCKVDLTSSAEQKEEDSFKMFTKVFNSKNHLENWIKIMKKEDSISMRVFKGILGAIQNVFAIINDEKYASLKKLTMDTMIMPYEILSFTYYETSMIVKSIQRILKVQSNMKVLDLESSERSLLEIYDDYITDLKNLLDTINRIENGKKRLAVYAFLEFASIYKDANNLIDYIKINVVNGAVHRATAANPSDFTDALYNNKLIQYLGRLVFWPRSLVNLMLPSVQEDLIYILLSSEGLTFQRRCQNKEIGLYLVNEFQCVKVKNVFRKLELTELKRDVAQQVNLEDYLDKKFEFNDHAIKLFIMLIQYHSANTHKNIVCEISKKENKMYEIKYSMAQMPSVEEIIEFYTQRNIPDVSTLIRRHKFSMLVDYTTEYSTMYSDDVEREPIETQLILLSCGHQLGFELKKEFFTFFIQNLLMKPVCHICRGYVKILGSYNTVVYKCK